MVVPKTIEEHHEHSDADQEDQQGAQDAITRFVVSLEEKIASLPDNPRIARVSGSPRCFTISSRDLGNNWTVEHHDFRMQYEYVIEAIQRNRNDAVAALHNAIASKRIRVGSGDSRRMVSLHPDVVGHLAQLWKEIGDDEE